MLRVLLLSTGIIAPLAFADVVLVYHSQQGDDPPTEQRLMIADGMIAIYGDLDIDRPTVVYDQSRSAFIFVNHGDRQYTVISEEWMKEASERYKAASKRMEEQMQWKLENMPPQQRSMYQQGRMMMPMMGPMMGGNTAASQTRTYLPSFGTQQIGGFSCRRIDVMEGVSRVAQLCVGDPATLEIPRADYQTIRAMRQTTENLSRQGGFNFGFKAPEFSQSMGVNTQGLVVQRQGLNSPYRYTLQSVRIDAVDSENFAPPDDYLEAKIPVPTM